MIRLLENDAITSKDIELNNMPFMHADLQFTTGTLFGAELFYHFKVSIPMLFITHIGFLFIILPTAIYCKYWATKPNIDPLNNLCRLILSLDVAINKCQREVSTLTLFHKSVALQTRTKMQCENNFYGSSVLDGEARSSG